MRGCQNPRMKGGGSRILDPSPSSKKDGPTVTLPPVASASVGPQLAVPLYSYPVACQLGTNTRLLPLFWYICDKSLWGRSTVSRERTRVFVLNWPATEQLSRPTVSWGLKSAEATGGRATGETSFVLSWGRGRGCERPPSLHSRVLAPSAIR